MLIFDAHEDLAYNILTFSRDYTRSVQETRALEAGTPVIERNEDSTLGYPEYRRGKVALVMGTLFASPAHPGLPEWDAAWYANSEQAYSLYNRQLDLYERLVEEHPQRFRLIKTRPALDALVADWRQAPAWPADDGQAQAELPAGPPVGIIISIEGADAIRSVDEMEYWSQRGVRSVGLAWMGTRFCGGTGQPGPLTGEGYALLERMRACNVALDISHMDALAALQAMEVYDGQVIASHSNAAALIKDYQGNRQLPDQVLRALLERDGVMNVVMYNAFLNQSWHKGERREAVGLEDVAAQIDYVCQMAGDALHVGIGTDFDGGFGLQSIPHELDSIADLQKLAPRLAQKGYCAADIEAVLSGNMIRCMQRVMPESE